MKIKFLGAAKVVTGSCYLCEVGDQKFLVDCGMFQGSKEVTRRNYLPFSFDPREISFVLLTHAHIDHSGMLPKLVKHGFKGKIYCTTSTKELCQALLEDSASIQKENIIHENKRRAKENLEPREPLFVEEDVNLTMTKFSDVNFDEKVSINCIEACFRNAGHILGSSIIEVFVEGKKIVFSGDLGQDNSLILDDPEKIEEADYLLMESTYGDRLHSHVDKRLEKLAQIINETYKKGGKLLIPIFAVERTQELIYSLEQLFEQKKIPNQTVFLDTPLGIKATTIFRNHPEELESDVDLKFPNLIFTPSQKDSMTINTYRGPAIIMSGSGMCNAGRIRHHIKHSIENKNNTLLFVGYQAKGTLGEIILSGEKRIRMMGSTFNVNSRIESIDSFSGHADQAMLLNWLKGFKSKPKKVFIIHGEDEVTKIFSSKVEELGMETIIPEIGDEVDI